MQSLVEKHGDMIVNGGPLNGKSFKQLTNEQLKKAAKRYQSDPKLQKFAKACTAIMELGSQDEPIPCVPLKISNPPSADEKVESQFGSLKLFAPLVKLLWKCLTHPFWGYVCLLVVLLLLARPVVVNAVTKYCAKLIRLGVRQTFTFISMLLESVADELIYQLDYALRESLPPHIDFKEVQKAPLQTFAHLLSAGLGAGFMYLATIVRAQRAVQ